MLLEEQNVEQFLNLYFLEVLSVNITENDYNEDSIENIKPNIKHLGPASTGIKNDNSKEATGDDVDTNGTQVPPDPEAIYGDSLDEEKNVDDKLPPEGLAQMRPLDTNNSSKKRSEIV